MLLAGAVLTEEKEAAVDNGLAAGAREIGRGGDATEKDEEVPEGVETFDDAGTGHRVKGERCFTLSSLYWSVEREGGCGKIGRGCAKWVLFFRCLRWRCGLLVRAGDAEAHEEKADTVANGVKHGVPGAAGWG